MRTEKRKEDTIKKYKKQKPFKFKIEMLFLGCQKGIRFVVHILYKCKVKAQKFYKSSKSKNI